MMRPLGLLAAMGMGTGVALAAEPGFIEGVYVQGAELCAKARAAPDGLQTIFEEGGTVLTASGIEGIEYHCEFLDVKKSSRNPGYLVQALCEEPDYAFPDTIAVMPRGEGELSLTAASDLVNADENSGNSGLWVLCPELSRP